MTTSKRTTATKELNVSIIHEVAAKAAKDLHNYASDFDCTLINLKALKACVAEVLREVDAELTRYEADNKCMCSGVVQYTMQQGIKGRSGNAYAQSVYRTARQLADIAGIEL